MRFRPRIALLLPLTLLGCAAGTPSSPPASTFNLSGNWEVIGTPTSGALQSPIASFMGALQSSNGTVTGTVRALDPRFATQTQCVPVTLDLPVTGTVSAAGNLSLTVPISGGTATITAVLGQNLETFTLGSYQIIGGACAMPTTQMTITQLAPVTGTYTGTFNVLNPPSQTPVPGTATAITATLTQSTTPNADGQFPLAGTITATGACRVTFTLTTAVVSGGGISQDPSGTLSPLVAFHATIDPTAITMTGGLFPLSVLPACSAEDYAGTLTRQ